jgi:hypothetical protein
MPNEKARLIVIGGVVSFVAGCLIGSSSDPGGSPYCVVSEDSKLARAGVLAGQVVAADDSLAGPGDGDGEDAHEDGGDAVAHQAGCLPGEQRICGWMDRSDPDLPRFVSQTCQR